MTFGISRLLAFVAVVVAALAIAPAASAGHWGWGWYLIYHMSEHRTGSCYYILDATCSGWNYWYIEDARSSTQTSYSKVLIGFETSSVIRGQWLYAKSGGDRVIIQPSDVSMGGWYLQSSATWWDGDHLLVTVDAWA
jgi:hypothetical protein